MIQQKSQLAGLGCLHPHLECGGSTLDLGFLAHEYATCRQRGLEEEIWVWCPSRVNREALLESSVERLRAVCPSLEGWEEMRFQRSALFLL